MKKFILASLISVLCLNSCSNEPEKKANESTTIQEGQSNKILGEGAAVISTAEFQKMISSAPIVLVDFSATWCGPCKKLAPRIDELMQERPGAFTLVKSDVDRDVELAEYSNITAMPTLMLYINGVLIWRNEGLIDKSELAEKIDEANNK